ncbi:MAG TPA: protein translocase subunit SecD, partial [Brevundimonas sp.]|nr:protein translocase subunit SecD [Brevundimonas sp.]
MIHLSRWKVILLGLSLAFGILFAYPSLLSPAQREALPGFLPKNTLNLGLDLQGGSYLLLEVDVTEMQSKRVANTVEDVRQSLSEAQITPVSIQPEATGVVVTFSTDAQVDAAFTAIRDTVTRGGVGGVADRQVTRLSNNRLRVAFTDAALNSMGPDAVTQSIEVVRRRIDNLGTREPSITRQGADRIVIQAPGESDPAELERVIGQTAQLTFQMVDVDNSIEDALQGRVPPDAVLMADELGNPILVKRRVLVSG